MQVVGSAFGPWFRANCSSTAQVAPRRVLRDPSGERGCAKIIAMLTLALDIDGVLLDSDRGGSGHWTEQLERECGVSRDQLREHFFVPYWDDVVNGRRPIEVVLEQSLQVIGSSRSVEDVLACWFSADFVPFDDAVNVARAASENGDRVILATNQEHRRAAYLAAHLRSLFPFDSIFYSAALGAQKHEPAFYDSVSRRLQEKDGSSSPVLFIDDLETNVQQARLAGWQAIHATPDQRWITDVKRLLRLPSR